MDAYRVMNDYTMVTIYFYYLPKINKALNRILIIFRFLPNINLEITGNSIFIPENLFTIIIVY